MTDLSDRWIDPLLALLAVWSIRWGVVLSALAVWFALKPPRRAATRHLLCALTLMSGVFLPFLPSWWAVTVPWPARTTVRAASMAEAPATAPIKRPTNDVAVAPERPALSRVTRAFEGRSLPVARPREALGAWRILVLSLAALWLASVAVLGARLLGGRLLLAKLRASALPVGEPGERLLDECGRLLALRRPLALSIHPAVASPVAIGGLRPLVLVPPDWDGWSERDQRACLLHELTHLVRRDDWAKLAEELVRVPFFFHPLVRWVVRRLDRERELLCDEAVINLGADSVGYARLLLDLSRRPGRLLPAAAMLRPAWLPFFDRGTVAVRIERLLEDDMTGPLPPPSRRRLLALGAVAFATAVGIGGLHVRAVEPQEKAAGSNAPPRAESRPPNPGTREIDGTVLGPRTVAPDELAGVVIDAQGKPLEGVEADAWHWVPGHVTHTDQNGRFRFVGMPENEHVEVRFRKEGYETQFHLDRAVGRPGWVLVLGNTTYFEGRVLDPDGNPVPGAPIRADGGRKRGLAVTLTDTYSDTKAGADGRYRLHVVPGTYDIQVRVPGLGVAGLSRCTIPADTVKGLDIRLTPGIKFVARLLDAESGDPVPNVRLYHWQKPGIEGTSDASGRVEIRDVPPGRYPRFQVDAKGYARLWSSACLSEWSRYQKDAGRGFQRNFDGLDFEIGPDSKAVIVMLERAATITGHVLDPDGKPVAGATAAPALTGTGNSLTGDTRFSVVTDADGRFTMSLPASGDRDYNLVAHDGKYSEWRTWANGVLPPFRTRPGQEIRDVELRLTRPATVRGRVIDTRGNPVAGREVRASARDRLENRYYDPTTKTAADGTYELKYIRAGEQFIQVAPFWLDANQAPEGTSVTVELEPGQLKEGVDFKVPPGGRGAN